MIPVSKLDLIAAVGVRGLSHKVTCLAAAKVVQALDKPGAGKQSLWGNPNDDRVSLPIDSRLVQRFPKFTS